MSWTPDTWDRASLDIWALDALDGSRAMPVAARVRPTDATMTRMVTGRPTSTRGRWGPDDCSYCRFRPLAPPGTPESEAWYWGTGDGAHDPFYCQPCKRYVAEGAPYTDENGQYLSLIHI